MERKTADAALDTGKDDRGRVLLFASQNGDAKATQIKPLKLSRSN
jgi:hypothetical protein